MVMKLTAKIWAKTGVIFLACMAIAVPLLWYYGSAVLMILRGETPSVTESRSLIFIMSGVGLLALLIGLFSVIALFANPVSKQMDSYLAQIIEWYGQYPDIMAENNLGL